MIKHQLSFAKINILNDHIAEVIVNKGVDISLEMTEEYDDFLAKTFSSNFAVLVNKIHQYDLSFEAKLNVASHENLTAIAVITYDKESKEQVKNLATMREHDGWNLRIFDGLNLGWQDGLDWIQSELSA
ncbi:hypothetical protein [Colwellia echini]|uniref:Uncharacterized protein n=1 Tax=Colwellia echini TaxID=1982103 RepID=A0ABY3N0T6_9GAMM|nr:hypothetical protein [Colwellia echini]TYK67099.1 hypothetical protein CWS31_000740 [Colwellia echini]